MRGRATRRCSGCSAQAADSAGRRAGGIYDRLGERLRARGVASLEVDYRRPGRLAPCVADLLAGADWLTAEGKRRLVFVGHSFGGAVVISAGVQRAQVVGAAALSSQTAGTDSVSALSPRPTLFIHREADEILPARCSRDLYARAREPKQLILYPGCRHGLDQCRDQLDADLMVWFEAVLEF